MIRPRFRPSGILAICLCMCAPLMVHGQAPFHHGVNLTGWLQGPRPSAAQFSRFHEQDFADIRALGCDVVRLPVNFIGMTSGAPDFAIDPSAMACIDSATVWASRHKLYLIVDNHSLSASLRMDESLEPFLLKIWQQLAAHLKNTPATVYYEIFNEPHDIPEATWDAIQGKVIAAIRAQDATHTIIVGPSGWNSYNDLKNMTLYSDTNLLYTFHFYDPFLFTHQGASWPTPSLEWVSGITYPYNGAPLPKVPANVRGTWLQTDVDQYPVEGNDDFVRSLIDRADAFRKAHDVKIFCGELGVYTRNSTNDNRVYWYGVVTQHLNAMNIPWTLWDYKGNFGIFKKGSAEAYPADLNAPLLEAVGWTVPSQH